MIVGGGSGGGRETGGGMKAPRVPEDLKGQKSLVLRHGGPVN